MIGHCSFTLPEVLGYFVEGGELVEALRLVAGESKTIQVSVVTAHGAPVDLTGFSIVWTLGNPVKITKSTTLGTILVPAPPSGLFTFALSQAETLALQVGESVNYVQEAKIKSPAVGAPVTSILHDAQLIVLASRIGAI